MSVQIPEEVATLAGGPEPIGPPGEPPLAPPGDPMAGGMGGTALQAPAVGLPPELMGLLAGGGGASGRGGAPPEEEEGEGSEVDSLSAILDQTMQYMQIASDDIEKSKMMKAASHRSGSARLQPEGGRVGRRDRSRAEGHGEGPRRWRRSPGPPPGM